MDTVTFIYVIYNACPYSRFLLCYAIDDENLILQ